MMCVTKADLINILFEFTATSESPRVATVSPKPATKNVAGSREFDPLSSQKSVEENAQNKVMSSFGINSDGPAQRTGTPDSVSSIGSANKPPAPQGSPMRQPGYPQGQKQSRELRNLVKTFGGVRLVLAHWW